MKRKTPRGDLVDLYLRFRWLLGGIKDLPALDPLRKPNTEAILAEIVRAWREGEPQPMQKLLIHQEFGHLNTIRKRIYQLESAGMVRFDSLKTDSRVKLVVPTEQALRILANYATAIRKAGNR